MDGEDEVDKEGAWRACVISGKVAFGFDWNPEDQSVPLV